MDQGAGFSLIVILWGTALCWRIKSAHTRFLVWLPSKPAPNQPSLAIGCMLEPLQVALAPREKSTVILQMDKWKQDEGRH